MSPTTAAGMPAKTSTALQVLTVPAAGSRPHWSIDVVVAFWADDARGLRWVPNYVVSQ
ncbi:hypothetical protein GCM10017691_19400 [Pseudonocardia petroleophila]